MKYDLVGINGNAWSVMGYVIRAMRECKFSKEQQNEYQTMAMSSDYNNLLRESVLMIDRCNEIVGEDWEDEEND